MSKSGWLLIPVGGIPDDLDTEDTEALIEFAERGEFDMENRNVYADISEHGQFAFIDSDEAPTFSDALKKLRLT
jgi:hypothetical protein